MPLSEHDREQLADDIIMDRRIPQSLYCGHCGYNLKTLPRSYKCPECGSEYHARPPHLRGIYLPHENALPVSETVGLISLVVLTGVLVYSAWNSGTSGLIAAAVIFGGITIIVTGVVIVRTIRFLRIRRLTRQIERQQKDED